MSLTSINDAIEDLIDSYEIYAPVTSLTSFTHQAGYYYTRAGLFTPIRSISEAREVIVSPLHIALQGVAFNLNSSLESVTCFLRDELDAVTELDPLKVVGVAFTFASSIVDIAATVVQAIYDTLLSVLTIATRLAATIVGFGVAGLAAITAVIPGAAASSVNQDDEDDEDMVRSFIVNQ